MSPAIRNGLRPAKKFNLWVLVVILCGSAVAIVKAQTDHSTADRISDYHGQNAVYRVVSDR